MITLNSFSPIMAHQTTGEQMKFLPPELEERCKRQFAVMDEYTGWTEILFEVNLMEIPPEPDLEYGQLVMFTGTLYVEPTVFYIRRFFFEDERDAFTYRLRIP